MSFDLAEEKLITIVNAFHSANYPTMEVNFQGKTITDLETIQDPFVKVEWLMRTRTLGIPPECYEVTGDLVINHFVRENVGGNDHTTYAAAILAYLQRQTREAVTFDDVDTYPGSLLKGFDGMTIVVPYEVEFTL